jgi:hypothetical protein
LSACLRFSRFASWRVNPSKRFLSTVSPPLPAIGQQVA